VTTTRATEAANTRFYRNAEARHPGELKSNPNADTASKAWLDLSRYSREILAAEDARRFALGSTLCGPLMRISAFDRFGAGVASERFDTNEDGLQFVITILGFLWINE
jgi:hypothetical protein